MCRARSVSLEKRNLVIDTGAYPSVIDRDLAQKLSLSGHKEESTRSIEPLSGAGVTIPDIEVGPIHATKVRSLVQDLSDVSQRAGVRIDALVGLNVLAHSSFGIDYGAKKITFGPSTPPLVGSVCTGEWQALRRSSSRPRPLRMLVDTGAEKAGSAGFARAVDRALQPRRAFANLGGSFVLQEIRLD